MQLKKILYIYTGIYLFNSLIIIWIHGYLFEWWSFGLPFIDIISISLKPISMINLIIFISFFLFNISFKAHTKEIIIYLILVLSRALLAILQIDLNTYIEWVFIILCSAILTRIIYFNSQNKYLKGIVLFTFFFYFFTPPFIYDNFPQFLKLIVTIVISILVVLRSKYLISEFSGKISFNHLKSDNTLQKEINAGQFASEKIMETKMKLKGTPFYIAITSGIIFVIGLFLILPDFRWWQQKQRGYWGHDDFSGLKSFMSSTSDGTAWVIGLGLALLITIVALFAHFNQSSTPVAQTSDKVHPKEKEQNSETPKKKAKSKGVKVEDDIPKQIEELSKLKEKGILTQKEFNAKKKELLDRL